MTKKLIGTALFFHMLIKSVFFILLGVSEQLKNSSRNSKVDKEWGSGDRKALAQGWPTFYAEGQNLVRKDFGGHFFFTKNPSKILLD